MLTSMLLKPFVSSVFALFLDGDCAAIPFMVREPHHERDCLIVNSSIYPFGLSLSKGSE
jgi:hypothetical protein